MKKHKAIKLILLFVVFIFLLLFLNDFRLSLKYKNLVLEESLTDEEVDEVAFIYTMKQKEGGNIWIGLDTMYIPLVLYNNKFEFYVHKYIPDTGWEHIDRKVIQHYNLFRRPAENPQAFSIKLDNYWAASIGLKDQMNREMYWGIRNELPPVLNRLFPFGLIKITDEIHISTIFHEMFHSFQANQNEFKYLNSEESHKFLSDYPYENVDFAGAWNKEGKFLMEALKSDNREELCMALDSFNFVRNERRVMIALSVDQIQAEKKLEWLEGLAKYAEYQSYISAALSNENKYDFKSNNAYWQREQSERLMKLGNLDGDNRFYHSGCAQAFILDKIQSGDTWKIEIMKDSVYLEDLLFNYKLY